MKFIDLGAQRARIKDNINRAVADVIESGSYILGPQVSRLEEELASYVGVKHAIACANGTDALFMPLMAYKIGPGDAVFCPSFTFAATAEVVALAGATPVFVDIEADGYNMSPQHLHETIVAIKKENRLTPKAIIAVDLFGVPADYKAITQIAAKEGLILIEDAAQSIGGKNQEAMCGAFGHVASTSFYPAKPLGCYGDGGAVFTNDDWLADCVRSILFHGKGTSQYDNIRIGLNSRLDTIQAAILLEKLPIFEDEMERRSLIGKTYAEALKHIVKTPEIPAGVRSAYAQYTIEVERRDSLKLYLQECGIPSMIYYSKPLHLQAAYRDFPRGPGGLPVSENKVKHVISLPMYPYLPEEDQEKVIKAVRKFYAG